MYTNRGVHCRTYSPQVGQAEAQAKCIPNQYADFLEEAGGVDIIEELQSHEKVYRQLCT
jgi:hypothetical protein